MSLRYIYAPYFRWVQTFGSDSAITQANKMTWAAAGDPIGERRLRRRHPSRTGSQGAMMHPWTYVRAWSRDPWIGLYFAYVVSLVECPLFVRRSCRTRARNTRVVSWSTPWSLRKSKHYTHQVGQWVNTVQSETPPHTPHTGGKPHQDWHQLHDSHNIDRQYRNHQSLGRIITIIDCSRWSSSMPPSTRHTK